MPLDLNVIPYLRGGVRWFVVVVVRRVRWKLFDQLRETFVAEVERGRRRRKIGCRRTERVTTPADAVAAETTRVGQTGRRHAARRHDGAAGDRRRTGGGRARVRGLLRVTTSRQNAVVHRRQLKLAGFLKGAHRHVHGANDQRTRRLREDRRREKQLQVVGRRRHVRAAQPRVSRQIFDRQSFRRIDGQQAANEIFRRLRNALPRRRVVGQLRSSDVFDDVFGRSVRRQRVERHFAAEHRVENHAQRPEIARLVVTVDHGMRRVRRNERDARARRRRRAGRGGRRRRRTRIVQRRRCAQHFGGRVSIHDKSVEHEEEEKHRFHSQKRAARRRHRLMFRSFLRETEIDDFDLAVRMSRRKQKILNERHRSIGRSGEGFYLWFEIPMANVVTVHEVHRGHEFSHQLTGLFLGERRLRSNPIEQFATG